MHLYSCSLFFQISSALNFGLASLLICLLDYLYFFLLISKSPLSILVPILCQLYALQMPSPILLLCCSLCLGCFSFFGNISFLSFCWFALFGFGGWWGGIQWGACIISWIVCAFAFPTMMSSKHSTMCSSKTFDSSLFTFWYKWVFFFSIQSEISFYFSIWLTNLTRTTPHLLSALIYNTKSSHKHRPVSSEWRILHGLSANIFTLDLFNHCRFIISFSSHRSRYYVQFFTIILSLKCSETERQE